LAKKTIQQKRKEEQLDFAKAYVMLDGNLTMAATTSGVPYGTARRWSKTASWLDMVETLKQGGAIAISPKMQSIIAKSLSIVEDRLEKGDFFYDPRTGKIERKPVNVRDAHAVFKDTFKMKQEIERGPEEAKKAQTIQETLEQLAKNFEALAAKQKQKAPVVVTDVLFVEEARNEEE
jgi:hypothetical protein